MSSVCDNDSDDNEQPRRETPRRQSMSKRQSLAFELPTGGEYYETTVGAPSVGVLFYGAKELEGVLISSADREITWELRHRPVVTFLFEESAGYRAGVDKGHVLCKVNDEDVSDKQSAVKMIQEAVRPMKLFFYCPPWSYVHNAEGSLLVHIGTNGDEMTWPKSLSEWKKRYTVVGGLLAIGAGPMLKMYKSKGEYSSAVFETVNSRKVTTKVEAFSLQGASILSDNGEEDHVVRYEGSVLPLTYIVLVVPGPKKRTLLGLSSSPKTVIKLASFQPMNLRCVWEGIQRTIQEQEPGQGHDDGQREDGIPQFVCRRNST